MSYVGNARKIGSQIFPPTTLFLFFSKLSPCSLIFPTLTERENVPLGGVGSHDVGPGLQHVGLLVLLVVPEVGGFLGPECVHIQHDHEAAQGRLVDGFAEDLPDSLTLQGFPDKALVGLSVFGRQGEGDRDGNTHRVELVLYEKVQNRVHARKIQARERVPVALAPEPTHACGGGGGGRGKGEKGRGRGTCETCASIPTWN